MQTPQELLGVSQEASVSEIRSAYRALARRWHPDRFAPGPERDWAGEKMAQINSAYRDLLRAARSREDADADKLTRVKALIADGRLSTARELLMGMPTRCAEWNYLFGEILMKLADYKKALIYLSVSAHQKTDSPEYARAFSLAQARTHAGRVTRMPRLRGLFNK